MDLILLLIYQFIKQCVCLKLQCLTIHTCKNTRMLMRHFRFDILFRPCLNTSAKKNYQIGTVVIVAFFVILRTALSIIKKKP